MKSFLQTAFPFFFFTVKILRSSSSVTSEADLLYQLKKILYHAMLCSQGSKMTTCTEPGLTITFWAYMWRFAAKQGGPAWYHLTRSFLIESGRGFATAKKERNNYNTAKTKGWSKPLIYKGTKGKKESRKRSRIEGLSSSWHSCKICSDKAEKCWHNHNPTDRRIPLC